MTFQETDVLPPDHWSSRVPQLPHPTSSLSDRWSSMCRVPQLVAIDRYQHGNCQVGSMLMGDFLIATASSLPMSIGDLCATLNICVIVGWSTRQQSYHDKDNNADNNNGSDNTATNNRPNKIYKPGLWRYPTTQPKHALVLPTEKGWWSGPPPPEYQKSCEFTNISRVHGNPASRQPPELQSPSTRRHRALPTWELPSREHANGRLVCHTKYWRHSWEVYKTEVLPRQTQGQGQPPPTTTTTLTKTTNPEYRDMLLQTLTKPLALVLPKEQGCWSGPPPPE